MPRTLLTSGSAIPKSGGQRWHDDCYALRKVKEGDLLISVHTEDSTERARTQRICEQEGAEDIADTAEARV
jgi:hypothetical protein